MLWLNERQLKSKNAATRRKAVEQLCQNPTSRALGALRTALSDEDIAVRRLATIALGKMEDDQRVEPLLTALSDPDASVVREAVMALKKSTDPRVVPALVPQLRHNNAAVRGGAAQVLETFSWRPTNVEDEIWLNVAKGKFSRAAASGPAAIGPLEVVLDSGLYSLCVPAVQALGEIGNQRAFKPLLKALKAADAAVCVAAIDALSKLGGPLAAEPIAGMLRHANGQVRLTAVEVLGSMGASGVVEPLRLLLRDSLWDVRRATAETLGRLKDTAAVDALTSGLGDADADVRETIANSLGMLKDRRGIGPLVLALKDSNSSVRRIAAGALSRIDGDWSSAPEAQAAVEQLKSALHDKDPDLRHFVGQLLVGLGSVEPEHATAPAPAEWSGASPEKRRKLAVSLFLAILCDADRDLRQAAAEVLGELGDRRAESALNHSLGDPDPGVRYAAKQSLPKLGTAAA